MKKYLIYLTVISLFILGCAAKIGRNPDMPLDSITTSESGAAISVPFNIADPSIILTIIAIMGIGIMGFAALAVLGMVMWQRNSRGSRRRRERKKNDKTK